MARGDDRKLVQRILAGERQAFEAILDAHETPVYRLALRYTNSVADAEDLTQDIFLGVYNSLPRFEGRAALGTWIYRIALNHCLEYQRRRKPIPVSYDEGLQLSSRDWRTDPVAVAERTDLATHVEQALHALSPAHRDVVVLHELQGLTYQEVATALDVPVGTVKSRLSNALRRLRDLLGTYVFEGKAQL